MKGLIHCQGPSSSPEGREDWKAGEASGAPGLQPQADSRWRWPDVTGAKRSRLGGNRKTGTLGGQNRTGETLTGA